VHDFPEIRRGDENRAENHEQEQEVAYAYDCVVRIAGIRAEILQQDKNDVFDDHAEKQYARKNVRQL
jgi:hypothetical protein